MLRCLHELGLRIVGLTNNGRNAIADGLGTRTGGGLTHFGTEVVQEMRRLNMLIDLTHISDRGFADVLNLVDGPVIDSHSNARAISDFSRNRSDAQIKALAACGGIIGVCPNCAMLGPDQRPTMDNLINHVDHIVNLVGIDHVAVGTDHIDFELCDISMIWSPAPGWLEGVFYGERDRYFLDEFRHAGQFPNFRNALAARGYDEESTAKILGLNLMRVFKQVLI